MPGPETRSEPGIDLPLHRGSGAYLLPRTFTPCSLTAICLPAIVMVVLRAEPVLAAAVTVTEPLPEPEPVFSVTHDAVVSFAAAHAQPDGAVTLTDFEPPLVEKDSDVVDTE